MASQRDGGARAAGHATLLWSERRGAGPVLLQRFRAERSVEEVRLPPQRSQALVLVLGGEADVEASADGAVWHRSRHFPGRVAMTAPGRAVRLRWRTSSARPLETLHLHLPEGMLQEVAERTFDREVRSEDLPDTLGTADPVVRAAMTALQRPGGGEEDLAADALVQRLAVHLLGRAGAPAPSTRGADARVRRVAAHMRDNLAMPLSLDALAAVAGLSPFHLLRLFRDATGDPPHRYLTRLRIATARELLARDGADVTEIAYRCGFSTPSHFAAAFRAWTGTSPSGYRRAVSGRPG